MYRSSCCLSNKNSEDFFSPFDKYDVCTSIPHRDARSCLCNYIVFSSIWFSSKKKHFSAVFYSIYMLKRAQQKHFKQNKNSSFSPRAFALVVFCAGVATPFYKLGAYFSDDFMVLNVIFFLSLHKGTARGVSSTFFMYMGLGMHAACVYSKNE